MKKRLAKEFHPLLLPWVAGIGACVLLLFARSDFWDFLANFTFCACVCLIIVLPWGTEFQQRTLPLLLSQPCERRRLWREKLLISSAAAISLLVLRVIEGRPTLDDSLAFAGFLFLTMCAGTFWTLAARTTIGGAVLSVTSQFLAIGLVAGAGALLEKISGVDLDTFLFKGVRNIPSVPARVSIVVAAGAICLLICLLYCGLYVWLGWRQFAGLELRDVSAGESAPTFEMPRGVRWWGSWLRCRPSGSLANLLRKELRLQKPVFMMAAILSLCWMVALVAFYLTSSASAWGHEFFVIAFAILTVGFTGLTPVLAGCLLLTEEKTLGLNAWHLSLPISAARQWLAKFAAGAIVVVVVGVALPMLLASLAAPKAEVGLVAVLASKDNAWRLILVLTGVGYVLSFWAGTLLDNFVKVALGTVLLMMGMAMSAGAGVWCMQNVGPFLLIRDLAIELLEFLRGHFALPPESLWNEQWILTILPALVVPIALVQSLIQFRRGQSQSGVLRSYVLILALSVFLASVWCTAFQQAAVQLSYWQKRWLSPPVVLNQALPKQK